MPFAQWKDPKVQLKMEYLDAKHKKGLVPINGRGWYSQEASRAINQAIGRIIRHKYDYGLILLVDERYSYKNTQQERSKWLRDRQINYKNFNKLTKDIDIFFKNMENENFPSKSVKNSKYLDEDEDDKDDDMGILKGEDVFKSSKPELKNFEDKQKEIKGSLSEFLQRKNKRMPNLNKKGITKFFTPSNKETTNISYICLLNDEESVEIRFEEKIQAQEKDKVSNEQQNKFGLKEALKAKQPVSSLSTQPSQTNPQQDKDKAKDEQRKKLKSMQSLVCLIKDFKLTKNKDATINKLDKILSKYAFKNKGKSSDVIKMFKSLFPDF